MKNMKLNSVPEMKQCKVSGFIQKALENDVVLKAGSVKAGFRKKLFMLMNFRVNYSFREDMHFVILKFL